MALDDYLLTLYGIYAPIAVLLTVWLARVLFRNGQAFLDEVFEGRPVLAVSVNRLLVVGFYLVNFGFACLLLEQSGVTSSRAVVEVLSTKLGTLLLVLAGMHFFNLLVFSSMRKRARRNGALHPPVAPHARVPAWPAQGSSPA